MATLKINKGTTYTISYRHRLNGVAASLVGATIFFTVKAKEFDADITDANAVIKKDVTSHTDAAAGLSAIALTPTDTNITPGAYFYDLRVKDSLGAIYKTDEGKVQVDGSPTNRQS